MAYTDTYNRLSVPYGPVKPQNLGFVILPPVDLRFQDTSKVQNKNQVILTPILGGWKKKYQEKHQRGKSGWTDLCFIGKSQKDWCWEDFYTDQGFQEYLIARNLIPKPKDPNQTSWVDDVKDQIDKKLGFSTGLTTGLVLVAGAFVAYKILT